MKPIEPVKPMNKAEAWWPENLGEPASSGSRDGMRYAVFPDKRRLLIERDGERTTYDTGDHRLTGVSQSGSDGSPAFSGPGGDVALADLDRVD